MKVCNLLSVLFFPLSVIKTDGYKLIGLFVISVSLYLPLSVLADARNTETPLTLDGGRIIAAEEAMQLQNEKKAFFADCRSAFNYGKGHIPIAQLVNYNHTYKSSTSKSDVSLKKLDAHKLPKSKNAVIVFYSHGSTGWKSYKAAKAAIEEGYKHVLWFRGGLQEWTDAGYSLEY